MYLLWSDLKVEDERCFDLHPENRPVENCCGIQITKAFISKKIQPVKQDIAYILSRMRATLEEFEEDRDVTYNNHTVLGINENRDCFYIENKEFKLPDIKASREEYSKFSKEFYEYFLEVHNK